MLQMLCHSVAGKSQKKIFFKSKDLHLFNQLYILESVRDRRYTSDSHQYRGGMYVPKRGKISKKMRIDKKRKPRISPWLAPTFKG